jgi:CubicO group peptidase (beta-lactamase class C family)
MTRAQERVQAAIDDLVARGTERGLQVAAYHDGELVVDAWAGLADAPSGRPVDGKSLFCVFSCTKGVTATAIHLLVDRGLLDYDTPIAHYWPEFGRNGKAAITVRHALAHTAGIPQVPEGIGPAMMCDWERTCRAIAGLTPLWQAGTSTGYHAITYGWILGETARRADGRPFAQIVHDEICQPLGITSFYLGIPDSVEQRVATLEIGPPLANVPEPPPDALIWQAIPASVQPLAEWANRPDFRRACIPAANGITNARSLARHYAALAGAVAGPRLLSPERMQLATTLQTDADDLVVGPGPRKALGYWIGGDPFSPFGSRPTVFGHGGAGGSIGFADPDNGFAFALTKTRMVDALPGEGAAAVVARATRAALGIPE